MPESTLPPTGRRSGQPRVARFARATLGSLALGLGTVLMVASCAGGMEQTDEAEGAGGSGESAPQPTSTAEAEPSPSGAAAPAPAPPRADEVPIVSAADGQQAQSAPPTQVEVPTLGASLPVEPTGVEADGQMEIPEDAAIGGWYRFGATPGDGAGDTVIAAHVGSQQTPRGPLRDLEQVPEGSEITVTDAEGTSHTYRSVSVEQVGKEGLDLSPYFSRSGPDRLVLITCGGRWLPELGQYEDNVILVAEASD